MIEQLAMALMRADGHDPNGPAWAERGDHYRRLVDQLLAEMESASVGPLLDRLRYSPLGRSHLVDFWRDMCRAARQP